MPKACGRGNGLMVQGKDCFDESEHACSTFEMTDVGLHRSDPTPRVVRSACAVDRGERRDLDRISRRRAGAVGFDVSHRFRAHCDVSQARRNMAAWASPLGDMMPTVRPSCATAPPRTTARTRSPSRCASCKAFEHDDTRAFSAAVSVGGRVEGLAPSVWCGGPGLVQNSDQSWADQRADTTRQRERRLACTERLARLVHRDQRRGARRIERNAWPA